MTLKRKILTVVGLVLIAAMLASLALAGVGGFVTHPFAVYQTVPPGDPGAGVSQIPGIPPIRSIEVWLDYVYIPAEDRFEPYARVRVLGQYDGSPFNAQVDDGHVLTFIAQQGK